MDYNSKRQLLAWICLVGLISSNFGECDPLPRRSGGHSGGSFGSRVRSSLFGGHSGGAKPSFGGSYPRQGGLSSGSYPKQGGLGSSSYPRSSAGSSHPGYTPFSSNRGNAGFSGSYPRQGGVGNTYNTYNRPTYSSSYPTGGSRGGLGGGLLGGGLGGASSYGRQATSRIGGRDMLKIGAGVAGGYIAGRAISNMFSGSRYPNGYWRDQDRYYYDQQQGQYYDSRRQQYSQAPPCDKPVATANTTSTEWQMYSECLEYFNAYKNQMQQQGGGGRGGYGGGGYGDGYYGAAVISSTASSTLIAVLLAAVLSYSYALGIFGARRNFMLTNSNNFLAS